MARSRLGFALILCGLGVAALASQERSAKADDSGTKCSLSGKPLMPIDLPIYDKADAGSAIARFTGAETDLTTSDFFPGGGTRVRVKTGGFRIEGFISASKLPVQTKKDVAIVAGHLWVGAHRDVAVTGASSGKLRVKRHAGDPFDQDFTASAACSSLTLNTGTPSGWSPPGEARGYVAKKDVELYDGSGADRNLVTIATPAAGGNGILFWSSDKSGSFVHVEYHGDVVIDAWARASDLHALAEGETMDQQANGSSHRSPARLKLADNPRVVKTTKEIAIRDSGSDKGNVIGHIESGTETYVLDTVAGWSSVLPKALNVAPAGDGQFWVKASEL